MLVRTTTVARAAGGHDGWRMAGFIVDVGEIPLDPSVREAVQKRQLLLELLPGCAASQAVDALAGRIAP